MARVHSGLPIRLLKKSAAVLPEVMPTLSASAALLDGDPPDIAGNILPSVDVKPVSDSPNQTLQRTPACVQRRGHAPPPGVAERSAFAEMGFLAAHNAGRRR